MRCLSDQEVAVLLRLPFASNREIAQELGISYANVKVKVSKIYKLLEVPELPDPDDKRIYAVVLAMKQGVITLADVWGASGGVGRQSFDRRSTVI
jgi:Response regulator containing a CheY-like receiver domain and an HTH DNA-binding domain